MKIALQRWIDRWVGVPLCHLLSWWPRRSTTMPTAPKAILVILLSEMGSLVLAVPMFRYLQSCYPGARLYVLLFAKNRELLDTLDVVDPQNILTIRDDSGSHLLQDCWQVIWRLRYAKLDGVIDCELFARISSILARLSGAKVHAGFHSHTQEGLYRGSFINRPLIYNPYLHISHQFLNLAMALQSPTWPVGKRLVPMMPPTITQIACIPEQVEAFWQRLYQNFPALQQRRLVLLYPSGGVLPIRAWPLSSYSKVANVLLDKGLAIGVIGLKSDQIQAQQLVSACHNSPWCINLAGYTGSIHELLLLLQRAALLITNDGGPGQFAALTAIPSIVLFGPETSVLYAPLSPHSVCLESRWSCAPCLTAYNHRNSPCDGNNACLQNITPEMVINQALTILRPEH